MNFTLANKLVHKYELLFDKMSFKISGIKYTYLFFVVYKLLLDVIYCNCIGDKNAFLYISITKINIIVGWLITFVMAYFFQYYYEQNTPSAIILIVFNLFYFIPITTYCGYGGGSSSFLFFATLYWIVLTLLQMKVPLIVWSTAKSQTEYSSYKARKIIIFILTISISIISIYIWGKYSGFRVLLTIIDVYDIRNEAATYSVPTFLQYFIQITRILVPMLILLALREKKILTFLWLMFITLINFSYEGSKTVILFPIILIGGYIFYRKNLLRCILPGVIILQVISILEQVCGKGLIVSLIFRRQGILLAKLSEDYYRFFISHSTDLFRNSIMGKLGFNSIYSQEISKVIGNNYETQVVNCNNGLLADVWSGLGLIGLIVMPVILILCFRFFDFVAHRVDSRLVISLAIYYAIIFMNTTWSTVLLTHGFFIMCVLMIIFPKENEKLCSSGNNKELSSESY